MFTDLSTLFMFLIFAHQTICEYVVLQEDYDDEPFYIDDVDYPKKHDFKPKKSVVHYGRHTYHLDPDFSDTTKLRSKLSKLYPDIYDYFDVFDISDIVGDGKRTPWNYILVLNGKPHQVKCKGKKCEENLRKYNAVLTKLKFKKRYFDSAEDYKTKSKRYSKKRYYTPSGHLKRFQIINNRKKHKDVRQPKNKFESSEEYHIKRKPKWSYSKKKKYSSESQSTENLSSDESKESREEWDSKSDEGWDPPPIKKYFDSNSDSRSSEESTEYTTKGPKKKYYSSESDSREKVWKDSYSESDSYEEKPRKKNKKKHKHSSRSSEETKRNFDVEELFLQGNKLYNANGEAKDDDKRRRLPQFLPKRFHWNPSEIHDLGYYWFNGPKGLYPDPTTLLNG